MAEAQYQNGCGVVLLKSIKEDTMELVKDLAYVNEVGYC